LLRIIELHICLRNSTRILIPRAASAEYHVAEAAPDDFFPAYPGNPYCPIAGQFLATVALHLVKREPE
jgi:hypothetical protein